MKFKTFPIDRQIDIMDCEAACLKIICKYYSLQLCESST